MCPFFFLIALSSIAVAHEQQACNGTYGSDCSCRTNMNAFLSQIGQNTTQATCVEHLWTYNGDINMGDNTWEIDQDNVYVTGSFVGSPSAKFIISLSPGDVSGSGLLTVGQSFTPDNTVLVVNLVTAPVGSYKMIVVEYGVPTNTPEYEFSPQQPNLPQAYSTCRSLDHSNPPGIFYYQTNVTMTVSILQNPNVGCSGDQRNNGVNRDWAIAIMIVLSLHAICLLLDHV